MVAVLALMLPVSASAAPEVWFKVRMPNITLFSDLSREETQAWAVELHQFEDGMCYVFKIDPHSLSPLTVVVFRSDRALTAFKPLKDGRPVKIGAFCSRIQFSNIAGVSDEAGDEGRRALYHEATHWITLSGDSDMPLWMAEGLAEAYSTFSMKGDTFTFGAPLPSHDMLLRSWRWIPIPQLLATDAGALNYSDSNRTTIFYAESWLACHYLVFGDQFGSGIKGIERYLDARGSTNPEEAFADAFGFTTAEFETRLRTYLAHGKYRPIAGIFRRPETERDIHLEPASKLDVDQAKAELLLGAGRVSEARARLLEVLAADPSRGRVKALLGLADLIDGQLVRIAGLGSQMELLTPQVVSDELRESAIRNLNGAIAMGESDQGILLTAAETIAVGKNQMERISGVTGLETDEARRAADLCERATKANPSSLRAARLLGGLMGALDPVTDADARTIRAATLRFPADPLVGIGAAVPAIRQAPREGGEMQLEALLNGPPALPSGLSHYARGLLEDARKLDRMDRLNELLGASRFDEALPLLDDEIRRASPAERPMLESTRKMARCAMDMARLVDWLNDGRFEEARPELQAIAADPSLAPLNLQAAQILQKIAEANSQSAVPHRDSN